MLQWVYDKFITKELLSKVLDKDVMNVNVIDNLVCYQYFGANNTGLYASHIKVLPLILKLIKRRSNEFKYKR